MFWLHSKKLQPRPLIYEVQNVDEFVTIILVPVRFSTIILMVKWFFFVRELCVVLGVCVFMLYFNVDKFFRGH